MTRPAPAQEDVPVDTLPTLVYRPCEATPVHVELFRTSDNVLLAEAFATVDVDSPLFRLDPGTLQPRVGYALVSTPDGAGPVVSVGFTTGSSASVPLAAPPAAVIPAGVAWWDGERAGADLVLAGAPDPDALSILTVSTATAVNLPVWIGPGDSTAATVAEAFPRRPGPQCYTVAQWDGAGRGQALSLPCVPTQRAPCGSPSAALLLAGLPVALRRRRPSGRAPGARRVSPPPPPASTRRR